MGLDNHTLKILENNRNIDSQSDGCHHFRISALRGILGRICLLMDNSGKFLLEFHLGNSQCPTCAHVFSMDELQPAVV